MPDQQNNYQNQEQGNYGKSYGKKNLWKWIIIYVVIGGVAYAAVYYFVSYNKGGYNYNSSQYNSNSTQQNPNYNYNP